MIILFAGPSIAGLKPVDTTHLEIRPPVQQGDVYMAALDNPAAIGIIDGYFEGVPSVWHKEILWAMKQGIPVLGASSMGALRAAELDVFGMIGVGAIFEQYKNETLEDDDEVALLHGPEEIGYPALSLAMVNVRATLKAAQAARVITAAQTASLLQPAKSEFYKTRTWDSVLHASNLSIMPTPQARALRLWIDTNAIDQKQTDAQLLIDRLIRGDFTVPEATYHFEETDLWITATKTWRRRAATPAQEQEAGYRLLGALGHPEK